MSISNKTKKLGVACLCQNAIALPQKCITNIDGKSITIESVDCGLTITDIIMILDIIMDE